MASTTDLHLVHPNQEEITQILHTNSQEWKGALDLPAYLRREAMLADQDLTRDSGLTSWTLVDSASPRTILCSCESLRKRALIARDGNVSDTLCHGVASVYCANEFRGKGYPSEMIRRVTEELATWQAAEQGKDVSFGILYSDIGKKFYARHGWTPFPSAHIRLEPWTGSSSSRADLPPCSPLGADDLGKLCELDEAVMRQRLRRTHGLVVAIVPDLKTIKWHLAREQFVAHELYGKSPEVHGAAVTLGSGKMVWCYWAKMWYNTDPQNRKGNSMHILRLATDDAEYDEADVASEEGAKAAKSSEMTSAVASLLAAAQADAAQWNMGEVEIWNPSSVTLAAARILNPSAVVEHREKESITSLKWFGDSSGADKVTWFGNEKYGWC
ncbi:hypothetical protein MBLNU457_5525t1 [Dothideomycetes sp. NU457]